MFLMIYVEQPKVTPEVPLYGLTGNKLLTIPPSPVLTNLAGNVLRAE